MRKAAVLLITFMVLVFGISGCNEIKEQPFKIEDPVTIEQVNTGGKYVARAFLESIFTDDRELFNKCYPDGYLERLGKAAGADVFEQYKSVMKVGSAVMGTASVDYRDYTIENGFDQASMKAHICLNTEAEYSEISQIQLQKIGVRFSGAGDTMDTYFYFVVYERNGNWYMLETFKGEMEF